MPGSTQQFRPSFSMRPSKIRTFLFASTAQRSSLGSVRNSKAPDVTFVPSRRSISPATPPDFDRRVANESAETRAVAYTSVIRLPRVIMPVWTAGGANRTRYRRYNKPAPVNSDKEEQSIERPRFLTRHHQTFPRLGPQKIGSSFERRDSGRIGDAARRQAQNPTSSLTSSLSCRV